MNNLDALMQCTDSIYFLLESIFPNLTRWVSKFNIIDFEKGETPVHYVHELEENENQYSHL